MLGNQQFNSLNVNTFSFNEQLWKQEQLTAVVSEGNLTIRCTKLEFLPQQADNI